MRFSFPTVHIVDRFGRDEDGCLKRDNLLNSVKRVIEFGVRDIELFLDHINYRSEQFDKKTIEELLSLKERYQLSFTAHLPFKYTDISALDEGVRKISVNNIISAIKITERLKVEAFVLHALGYVAARLINPNSPNPMKKEVTRKILDEMLEQANKSIKVICAEIDPKRIAVENLAYAPIESFFALADQNGCTYCFDVGHVILRRSDPIIFLNRYLSNTSVIHLHDAIKNESGVIIDHQRLGEGFTPINEILTICEEKSFEGPVLLELLNEDFALKSLEYLKAIGKWNKRDQF